MNEESEIIQNVTEEKENYIFNRSKESADKLKVEELMTYIN